MIEYKTWEGRYPYVILLSPDISMKVLYYEIELEQLHPHLEIINWMEERKYNYQTDWKIIRLDDNPSNQSEWAVCFNNKQVCELFVIKWL